MDQRELPSSLLHTADQPALRRTPWEVKNDETSTNTSPENIHPGMHPTNLHCSTSATSAWPKQCSGEGVIPRASNSACCGPLATTLLVVSSISAEHPSLLTTAEQGHSKKLCHTGPAHPHCLQKEGRRPCKQGKGVAGTSAFQR
ncbi:unnamed protein product [Prorocentrum cordatum]|uniref:Uncharacterized protein n=1 Tax=Prorocentrum cordatum TaxID=2364126 RepID=A0ABN9QRK8_9DINO|nr:unnamed protein product [Polarella glacialis]